jgi:hypothetical protein
MKFVNTILAVLFLSGCASTPFTFDGDNENKGYVVLSIGISNSCSDSNGLVSSHLYITSLDGKRGRALNLNNPFISADFDEDGSISYSFPLEEGRYTINKTSHGPIVETPYTFTVKSKEVQYLANIVVDGADSNCRSEKFKLIIKDKKKRDLKKAAESQPHLIKL